ncbi:hypothetical protein Btru_063014 [Bulinus truncatus]|nr:hypothetical protein Btru_063014 [Bulinus truncatus]
MKKGSDTTELNLVQFKERSLVVFTLAWGTVLLGLLFLFTESPPAVWTMTQTAVLSLYRDVYGQESWPGVEANLTSPLRACPIAHFYWCGKKIFRFEDYLGILSVIRVMRPQSMMFHYNSLPVTDDNLYHTWFLELTQSVPNLVLRHTHSNPACGSRDALAFGLRQLAREGGVYVSERTLLTRELQEAWSREFYFYSFQRADLTHDLSQGIFASRNGFPDETVDDMVEEMLKSNRTCYTVEDYENLPVESSIQINTAPCIVLTESLYPKDIWNGTTRFAELARWMFYGKRSRLEVQRETNEPIPRVSHVVWLRDNRSEEFQFLHYLSIISAIHVAGFDRVYVHGEARPTGSWWDRLPTDKVTFVKNTVPPAATSYFLYDSALQYCPYSCYKLPLVRLCLTILSLQLLQATSCTTLPYNIVLTAAARYLLYDSALQYCPYSCRKLLLVRRVHRQVSVFQHEVRDVSHQSAVIQLYTLLKYGGACQDLDVVWVSKLPDDLRRYPAVMSLDWVRHGEFPGVVNMGVVLAKPNARWLKYFIQTLNYYRESQWEFNTKMMSYKVYERHPDQVYIDRYLQVVCYQGICHPAWRTDYQREIDDYQPIIDYNWRDARAFHFIVPNPPSSLLSPAAIKEGFGMFSEIGREILAKSGQTDLIN